MLPAEVLAILADIDAGRVTVQPDADPSDWRSFVICRASNGWTFMVFNDCGGWDYIEEIESPTGEVFSPWEFDRSPAYKAACELDADDPTRHEAIAAASMPEWAAVRAWAPRDARTWGWT